MLVIDTKERKLMELNRQESVLISFQQKQLNSQLTLVWQDLTITAATAKIVLMTYH